MPFKDHLEFHDPWKYINYIFYLDLKEKNNYNGIENHVYRLMQTNQYSWLPIGNTIQLQDRTGDEMEKVVESLNALKTTVNLLKKNK
jgi:uncharacterized protein YxjI